MKRVLRTIILLALLVSLVPATALAKGPTESTIKVYNRTGADVDVTLTSDIRASIFEHFGTGVSEVTLPEGRYHFYASTQCGGIGGEINLTVSRELVFECGDGPSAHFKTKEYGCVYGIWLRNYYAYDGYSYNGNHFFTEEFILNSLYMPLPDFYTFIEMGANDGPGEHGHVEYGCWDFSSDLNHL